MYFTYLFIYLCVCVHMYVYIYIYIYCIYTYMMSGPPKDRAESEMMARSLDIQNPKIV